MKCRIQKSPSAQVSSIQNIAAFPPIFRASHEPARFPLGAFHHLLTAKPRTAAGERRHSCTTARHVRTKAPRLHRKKSALSHEHLGKRKGKTCIVWRTTSKPRYSQKNKRTNRRAPRWFLMLATSRPGSRARYSTTDSMQKKKQPLLPSFGGLIPRPLDTCSKANAHRLLEKNAAPYAATPSASLASALPQLQIRCRFRLS